MTCCPQPFLQASISHSNNPVGANCNVIPSSDQSERVDSCHPCGMLWQIASGKHVSMLLRYQSSTGRSQSEFMLCYREFRAQRWSKQQGGGFLVFQSVPTPLLTSVKHRFQAPDRHVAVSCVHKTPLDLNFLYCASRVVYRDIAYCAKGFLHVNRLS